MLELGRRRLPDIEWLEADAQDLPFDDASFDRVLSTFGAMFAPDPGRTAAELLRVTRPGGIVGMTTWAAGSVMDAAGQVLQDALPGAPPEGPAVQWDDAEKIRGHFGAGAEVTIERRALTWTFESPEAWLAFLSEKAPPIVAARGAIGEERWPEVAARILEVIGDHGRTTDGGFVEEPPYLLVLAERRA
jgi:SAM-dependent methyltransferase